jgi:hypothetical protein
MLLAGACRNGEDQSPVGPDISRPAPIGEARTLALGFSAMPAERTTESYIAAFATAAQYGEMVLIQRTPPWEDFFPNRQISDETINTTRLETALLDQYDNLTLVYAIDPTDPVVQRSRLANLPPNVSHAEGFLNEDIRKSFIAYTRYVVRNYEPEYLAIGVEINMLRDRAPEQFAAFLSLYREAYDNAKDADPDIKVFPTFQLEDLEGNLGQVHPPHWEAIDAFAGMIDVLAISTYPYLTDIRTAGDLRPAYYGQLRNRFDVEILIIDAAYPSRPLDGYRAIGTEEDQFNYVARLLAEAEEHGFSGVIWRAARDPSYAREGALSAFRDIGLRQGDGANKLAWGLWEEWARRPYVPVPN